MQRREMVFAGIVRRFRIPQQRESKYVKLVVGEEVVQDPGVLHQVWVKWSGFWGTL